MKRPLGKIKRHKKIYRKSNFRIYPLQTAAFVIGAAILFGVGWSLYQPVYDFLTGNLEVPPSETSESPAVPDAPDEAQSEEKPVSPQTKEEPAQTQTNLQGAYLPPAIVADEAALSSSLDSLKAKGLNSVLIDLKDDKGNLLFHSKNETAASVGAVSFSAVDLSRTASLIRQKGLEPIARLSAFKDPLASIYHLDMAVHYQNSEWAWLDNSQQNGGKAWLNPYSSDAQKYISDLCLEVADAGFDHIVLSDVQFPQGYALDLAGYGPDAGSKSKSAVLQEFTDSLRTSLEKKDASLYVYAEGTALLGDNNAFLGEDIWAPLKNGAAVGAMPASFGIAFENMESGTPVPMETPVIHPGKTVFAVASSLKKHLAPDANALIFLQAYTSLEFSGVNFLEYTQTQIDEQTQALKKKGFTNYILYNPSGTY